MEHVQTLVGGMAKDPNPLYQPANTIRDGYNYMLVSTDGNNYVAKNVKGNSISFTIPQRFYQTTSVNDTHPSIIGMISFLNKIVVFSTNDETSSGGYGEIGVVTVDKDGIGTYVPYYHHNDLFFSKKKMIRGYSVPENSLIQRVYWTDFLNEPRVLNIADSTFTTYIASGSIVSGKQYMVLSGAITYDGVDYGPGLTDTNIFTGTATTVYTVASGTPLVIEYIPVSLLSWTPEKILPEINFLGWIPGGTLNSGSKIYFVRYGRKNEGYYTSWSYSSYPINIGPGTGTYPNFQGGGYGQTIVSSTKGIELEIKNIDTSYDTIQVAAAEFDQSVDVLTKASIVVSLDITGDTMTVQHLGSENIQDVTIDELIAFPAAIEKVKDLHTNKNYNVIGDIVERSEIDFSEKGVTVDDLQYNVPADQSNVSSTFSNSNMSIANQDLAVPAPAGSIIPDGVYLVESSGVYPADYVDYNGQSYGDGAPGGKHFVGVLGVTGFVLHGTANVTPCIAIKKYTGLSGDVFKYIRHRNSFWDFKGMATSEYLRGYWSSETYRIGILFYDKKGNPFYVRWLKDHQCASLTSKGGLMINRSASRHTIKTYGLEINGLKIPSSIVNKISGFSIVRAERDANIVCQGMIWQTSRDNSVSPNVIRPCSHLNPAEDHYIAAGGNAEGKYVFYSPDALFGFTDIAQNYTSRRIDIAGWYKPHNVGAGNGYDYNGILEQVFNKFYDFDGTNLSSGIKISFVQGINPGGQLTGYDSSGYDYNSQNVKNAGFAVPVQIGSKAGTAGLHHLITTDVLYYGATKISDSVYLNLKPIANWTLNKTSFYGGTSDAAKANTVYISTGHYQEINAAVLADVGLTGSDYVFNGIQVFGGDCFVGIVDYGKTLYDNQFESADGSFSHAIFFPVESTTNFMLKEGRTVQKDGMHNNTNGVVYAAPGTGNARFEDLKYNNSYSTQGTQIVYTALPVNFKSVSEYPARMRWAGQKILGEIIDSFRTFLLNDYRDVGIDRGEINNVRARDGKLFYWQSKGVGYVPLLERQVLTANSFGAAVNLGVGGVIDRYDEMDTYFGNQHSNGLVETEYGFTWFDFRRRAWMIMSSGGDIKEVSFVKQFEGFFNTQFDPINETSYSPNLETTDEPVMGTGIVGVYDPVHKMTFMTWKWKQLPDDFISEDDYDIMDFTLGYHHASGVIVNFYNFTPSIWHNFNNWVLSAQPSGQVFKALHSYAVGDVVSYYNVNYVCIQAVTFGGVIPGYAYPDFPSSIYWKEASKSSNVFVHYKGDICKFYGQVYDDSLELIINPPNGRAFAIDSIVRKGNQNNMTSVHIENSLGDIAADTNISPTNRNYRYIDGAWISSAPISNKGRLSDYFLKLKFVGKNYTSDPTVSNNKERIVEFVKTELRIKQ